jgi:hypothetical protein
MGHRVKQALPVGQATGPHDDGPAGFGRELAIGRNEADDHQQAGHKIVRRAQPRRQQARRLQPGNGGAQIGFQRDMIAQLQIVGEEFEIDQPAARELHVERAFGGLVTGHFGAHGQNIGPEYGAVARVRRSTRAMMSASAAQSSGVP